LSWATALPGLHSLNLSSNRLQGPVPLRILMLEKKALGGGGNALRLPASAAEGLLLPPGTPVPATLDLRDQGLVGPLPTAFLQLPGLTCLDLSGANAFEGPLPLAALHVGAEAAGAGRLELRLGGGKGNRNAFRLAGGEELLRWQSTAAAGGGAAQLTRIALAGSCLVGPIPRELGRLSALTHLELASNALDGELPDGLAALSNLQVLSLAHNGIRGPLPSWLGGLTCLRVLDMAGNELRGPLPEALFTGCTALEVLRLGDNELTGPLPDAVGHLHRLQELSLPGNQLIGDLPQALFQLTALRVLDLGRQKQLQVSKGMDGRTDGRTDGWVGGWVGKWVDWSSFCFLCSPTQHE
jgi:Leucine-rich repeat (LRR) protein